jgi:hypothetical protein
MLSHTAYERSNGQPPGYAAAWPQAPTCLQNRGNLTSPVDAAFRGRDASGG